MSAFSSCVEYALSHFGEPKRKGKEWVVVCPCHDDHKPSLGISEGQDGRALFKCPVCSAGFKEVVAATGMDVQSLFPEGSKPERLPDSRFLVATYDYVNAAGEPYLRVQRYSDKQFFQSHWDGREWISGTAKRAPVLYRLPAVLQAIQSGDPVFVAEGEKDVHTLERLGLTATTAPGGAGKGKWRSEFTRALQGGQVRILRDNDAVGEEHAELVAAALYGKAQSVRRVELPDLRPKGDVTDWVKTGGTRAALEHLAATAPEWRPEQPVLAAAEEEEDELPPTPPLDEVLPFPVEAFPFQIQRFITESAASFPCPPDFLGVFALAILSAAIGNSRQLQVKAGWVEGARIYSAVVARPGEAKSPALGRAVRPLEQRQKLLSQDHERTKREYLEALEEYEQKLAAWKAAAKRHADGKYGSHPGELPEKPEEPSLPQIVTTDATLEALTVLLHQNPRGLLFFRDELAGWVTSMNAYRGGKGADRQAWLSFWSGETHIVNRRAEKEPMILDNPFVAVTGCIQPDVLPELVGEEGREDGFIHRILCSYPDPVPLQWTDLSISQSTLQDYQFVVDRLFQFRADEHGEPRTLTFSPSGYKTFREWVESHYAEMNDDLFTGYLRGPWAKMRGYCVRLALIVHLCRLVCGETDDESVDRRSVIAAAALVTYFKSHARRVYESLHATEEDKKLKTAAEWIRKRGGHVTAREVQQAGVAGVRYAPEAQELLRGLERRGYGKLERSARGKLSIRFAPAPDATVGTVGCLLGANPTVSLGTNGAGPVPSANGLLGCRVGV